MRLTSISSIAWLLFCASGVAQNKNAGGIVYGGKAAFNITAPEGWVLDTESGAEQGLPCVLYPKDSSLSKRQARTRGRHENDLLHSKS
jgi:hypothetical protein